ncbi:lipocalin family protein [Zavarzinella formosa]|uniref:lipocalin family protein n=1 Tax=Zavarzinella formosa TaxID=360055 RepID=UPI0003128556|nr:lipocalin family protein [Zavarzinella formosa]
MRRMCLALWGVVMAAVVPVVRADEAKPGTVDATKIVGVWEVVKSGTTPPGSTMEFTKEGTFKSLFKGQTVSFDGKYTVKDGKLTITPPGFTLAIKELTADKLVIPDLSGATVTEYKRQGAAAGDPKPKEGAGKESAASGVPDGWKLTNLEDGSGRVLLPKKNAGHGSESSSSTDNGVSIYTSTESYDFDGGVKMSITFIEKKQKGEDKEGKEAKPFAPFPAKDKKAGGTPTKLTDFAGAHMKGRTYTNVTKDGVTERHTLFQRADNRIYILTVSSKNKDKTTDTAADTFLKSLALKPLKSAESKK